ncbi:reverse transcriptase domain-containing protein [Tanacetum coccineum]
MTWHATGKCTDPDKMQHPVDGRAWKKFDTRQSYSMWPVILTTYNLPPWLCMKESYLTLTLLIHGPKSLGKDIDVYLRPLIDDLEDLWALKGVKTIDVATGQKFNMREMVLWTINDFPAQSSLSGWSEQGYMACPTCNEDTPFMLVARPNKNEKCSKPQAKYSFTPENRKKFCQFIKGVKPPDGFGSNFKHKVTDNDSNITGLKSHDIHIMMQRLLPYGLQQYLPSSVATPIIELCSFFKQICSRTLMEADMVKAQIQVIDIICNLELIYPPAFFDIMIHFVIHLPLEALEGGHIPPEGYVVEEALTFSSHYFRDVTTKFNRPDYHQELKKVIWYVLHNSLEIDMYRAKFKSEFPNQDMKEEFPDKDPGVSKSGELFALACGPTSSPISVSSCVVNGVRFVVHSRDERRTTQNNGICSPGEKDREMDYGQLEEILEFSYMSFKVVLFRVKWFDTRNEGHITDVDEDDDLIDDEDTFPHDLADSDDKDLTNDDDVAIAYSSEEED